MYTYQVYSGYGATDIEIGIAGIQAVFSQHLPCGNSQLPFPQFVEQHLISAAWLHAATSTEGCQDK